MPKVHSVGGVAKILNVSPRSITHLFYERILPDHEAPIIGGNRLIPDRLIATIAGVLSARGVRVTRDALDRPRRSNCRDKSVAMVRPVATVPA